MISGIHYGDINQIAYTVHDVVRFAGKNASDIERVAERFASGDFADAVKLILESGLNQMLMMCDMDDKVNEEDIEHPGLETDTIPERMI